MIFICSFMIIEYDYSILLYNLYDIVIIWSYGRMVL
jgi:hypothetical protein